MRAINVPSPDAADGETVDVILHIVGTVDDAHVRVETSRHYTPDTTIGHILDAAHADAARLTIFDAETPHDVWIEIASCAETGSDDT